MNLVGDGPPLARFRADPARVRVAVRRYPGGWVATIGPREGTPLPFTGFHKLSPTRAVAKALMQADEANLPGIDVGMQWAYEHPQGVWRPQ